MSICKKQNVVLSKNSPEDLELILNNLSILLKVLYVTASVLLKFKSSKYNCIFSTNLHFKVFNALCIFVCRILCIYIVF